MGGIGPIDPALARDLAAAAARNPKTSWCVTVTDGHGHAVGHGCARPEPGNRKKPAERHGPGPPDGRDPPGEAGGTPAPGFSFTAAGQPGPPGGYGTWRLRIPGGGPDLLVTLDPVTTEDCDHRFQARGHDPGVKLRHLAQVRYATCTSPVCRRPSTQSDFEHNIPYEAGGRTCLCNGGPKTVPNHVPTRSGTTLRQACSLTARVAYGRYRRRIHPRRGRGKDDERRATACASHETAPGA